MFRTVEARRVQRERQFFTVIAILRLYRRFPFATILCRLGVGLCGAQSIAVAEFHLVRPIFVVAPNLVSADRTSRKRAEFAVRSVLRCHQSVRKPAAHARISIICRWIANREGLDGG